MPAEPWFLRTLKITDAVWTFFTFINKRHLITKYIYLLLLHGVVNTSGSLQEGTNPDTNITENCGRLNTNASIKSLFVTQNCSVD